MRDKDTADFYETHASEFAARTSSIDVSVLYEPFLALIPDDGRILDAGCGSGRDSAFFLKQGYEVTAFDASSALVAISSALTGKQVLHMTFSDVGFRSEFDGVWACASLLHIPEPDIDDALARLTAALKHGGILYASFKYGSNDEHRDGRLFCDYDECRFKRLIQRHPSLHLIQFWQTQDVRNERRNDSWFNVLLRRQ